ncbi:MAG TPA: ABC transporter ATP-binding protein [Dehalococcoidia bacterium]|nr:ABC transporter ATP-binding protein [Dehalococcoidia bacterium]
MTTSILEAPLLKPPSLAATGPPPSEALLSVRHLVTEFKTHGGPLRAVDDVSFELAPARVLAVLGESGSGKSAMLRTILGIQPSSARIGGEVVLRGVDLLTLSAQEREQVRGSWLSMIFQDPMTALDPVFTVEQQLTETIRRHSPASRGQARQRVLELVQIPSPERRLKAYPFELSGGMRQRVVIAMALASNPSLLLADEPTTALDVTVQGHVLQLLRELQQRLGMSIIFVTHDLAVAAEIADDVAVMYAGRIVETGTIRDIVHAPQHPYTHGLLEANVRAGQKTRPEAIPGSPPNLARLPDGCAFAPRCTVAIDRCWDAVPELRVVSPTQQARCLRVGTGAP